MIIIVEFLISEVVASSIVINHKALGWSLGEERLQQTPLARA